MNFFGNSRILNRRRAKTIARRSDKGLHPWKNRSPLRRQNTQLLLAAPGSETGKFKSLPSSPDPIGIDVMTEYGTLGPQQLFDALFEQFNTF